MSTTPTSNPLSFSEFAPVGYADWQRLVEAELKGAAFDKKMFTRTPEGITLKPIYRREDIAGIPHVDSFPGFAPFVRGTSAAGYLVRPWAVSQEIVCASAGDFNHAARNSLDRGLNALNMVLDAATRNGHDPDWAQPGEVGLGGLSIATVQDLERALEGVDLEKTSLFVRSGASALPFAALLVAVTHRRKKPITALNGCIEMDPLGVIAHEGGLPQSLPGAYNEMAALASWAAIYTPRLQTVCVHSRSWHEAGGSAVQELAFTLATGVEYLRQMDKRGLAAGTLAPRMRFAVTVGTSFFMEIAKLRALRLLWSRAVAAAGGDAAAQKISLHVRGARWNKTTFDPYNNLLRATVEALAGAIGGCDSMQVGAFDEVVREPNDFSQRIARNTQIILQRECRLDRVLDPAGGSWCVESLTADLASRAWSLFQEVEKLGGMEAALRAGFPQKAVATTATEKLKAVSTRRESIVGVNQYANPEEKPLERPEVSVKAFHKIRASQIASHRTSLGDWENEQVLQKLSRIMDCKGRELFEAGVEAAVAGATLGEIARAVRISDQPGSRITPVCLARAAAGFERLREAVNRHGVDNPRPSVFLCNMGTPRDYKARSDFSRGFFSVAGYDIISPVALSSPETAAEEFAASGAPIAVICSTDEKYPMLVPTLVTALRARRRDVIVVLAGYPQAEIENFKKAGVDEFVHVRADALELLTSFHHQLGIAI